MAKNLNFGVRLSDRDARKKLPVRDGEYWEVLSYGRALGYGRTTRRNGNWVARMRLQNGKYRWHTLRFANDHSTSDGETILTFDQAIMAAQAWFSHPQQSMIASNTYPVGPVRETITCPIGDVFTVGHAIRDYIEWKRIAAAPSHFATVLNHANFHILPRVGTVPLAEFNGEHARAFIKDVLATPPKRGNQKLGAKRPIETLNEEELRKRKKTINTLISILRVATRMAWENGKFDSDRAWRCLRHLPNVERPRILHLNRNECRRLIARCAPDLANLVRAALYTGCRVRELLRMEAGHFDAENLGIHVTPVKTYRPRFVYLPDEGLRFFAALASGKRANDPLFVRSGGNLWHFNHTHPLKAAVLAAGLPRAFRFHDLRHTYASQLVQAGTPLIVVSEQLGHANTNTVSNTYAHLAPQIRESEVRQRFAPLLECQGESLAALPKGRAGYATLHDMPGSETRKYL